MTETELEPPGELPPNSTGPLSRDRLYRLLATGHIPLPALVQAIVVAEHLNLHRAAEALGVSQSAISTRLITLEETLGVQLFERRRYQPLRLTLHGRAFLDHVAPALVHIGQAVGTTDAGRDPRRDVLRVGLQSSITTGPAAELLRAFREAAPGVILRPEETPPQNALGEVRARNMDVLIAPDLLLAGSALHDTLENLPLWTEEMVVALPVGDPLVAQERVAWTDLAGRMFLTRTDGISVALMERARRYLDAAGIEPRIETLRVGRDTLMILVTLGLGVALTTESAQGLSIDGLVFRPVGVDPVTLRFLAIWSRYNITPPLTTLLRLARKAHISP